MANWHAAGVAKINKNLKALDIDGRFLHISLAAVGWWWPFDSVPKPFEAIKV
jgi:hypothetical protein